MVASAHWIGAGHAEPQGAMYERRGRLQVSRSARRLGIVRTPASVVRALSVVSHESRHFVSDGCRCPYAGKHLIDGFLDCLIGRVEPHADLGRLRAEERVQLNHHETPGRRLAADVDSTARRTAPFASWPTRCRTAPYRAVLLRATIERCSAVNRRHLQVRNPSRRQLRDSMRAIFAGARAATAPFRSRLPTTSHRSRTAARRPSPGRSSQRSTPPRLHAKVSAREGVTGTVVARFASG
jgi:hypothetical protein